MEHIKTPVYLVHLADCSDINDAEKRLICILRSREDATEITVALNEHDDLIKERYALILQRDALVVACKMLVGAIEEDWADPYVEESVQKGHTALALVKGDQKSDDADQG